MKKTTQTTIPLRQHCSAAREYIYQQYRQLGTNNKNNSLVSANVGRAQVLSKLSLKLV